MDSNEKFYVYVWGIIATALVTIVLGAFAYNSHKNDVVAKAVANSPNPIAAACAFNAVGSNTVTEAVICLKAVEK